MRPARDILHTNNLKGFHELRAAYACERYEQITCHLATINGGRCSQLDLQSRPRGTLTNQL